MFERHLTSLAEAKVLLAVFVLLGLWALIVELRKPSERPAIFAHPESRKGCSESVILIVGLWLLARTAWRELGGLDLHALRPWDLAVYVHAAPTLLAGFNPYDPAELARVSGQSDLLSCYYPPLTVAAFTPLARMQLASAALLVLGLKLALLAGLLRAWTRRLGPWVVVVTALLWLYAIQIDLNSGNVSVFEQALLWAGVAALLAGRRLPFAALIASAAVFKLQLISMAALALVVDPRHGWRLVCIALGGLSAYLLIGTLAFPGPSETWYVMARGAAFSEGGFHAPSLAAALRHRGVESATLVLAVMLVLAGSIWVLWRARERPTIDKLMFAMLALTLAWPRLKDYGFIIVIPPAACTIAWLWAHERRWLPKLAIAGLLAAIVMLTREHPETANDDYRPTLLLLILWLSSAATLLAAHRPRSHVAARNIAPGHRSDPQLAAPPRRDMGPT